MSRPKDQPLASEKLAENVKADVTTKGLQAIPSGSTQTNGATVPWLSSKDDSVIFLRTTVHATSPVEVSLAEEGGGDTEEDKDFEL